MGPQSMHVRLLNSRVYSKTITKIQAWKTYQTIEFSLQSGPNKYVKAYYDPIPKDEPPLLDKDECTHVQCVVGRIPCYARAVYLAVLMALSSIATDNSQATNTTIKNVLQFLEYLEKNPNATMQYYASGMILNIHSGASYI